jgi:hypothetical protein
VVASIDVEGADSVDMDVVTEGGGSNETVGEATVGEDENCASNVLSISSPDGMVRSVTCAVVRRVDIVKDGADEEDG